MRGLSINQKRFSYQKAEVLWTAELDVRRGRGLHRKKNEAQLYRNAVSGI
jgi:hypothetical protein